MKYKIFQIKRLKTFWKKFVCRLCLLINIFFFTQKISALTIVLLNVKSLIFDFLYFCSIFIVFIIQTAPMDDSSLLKYEFRNYRQ